VCSGNEGKIFTIVKENVENIRKSRRKSKTKIRGIWKRY